MKAWKVLVFHNGKLIDNLVVATDLVSAIMEVLSGGWAENQIFSVIPADTKEVFNEMVHDSQEPA